MSPDAYLQFGAGFIGYSIKIALAYLLCWLLSRLVNSPRQRFGIWLAYMFGSLGYWIYILGSALSSPSLSPASTGRVPRIAHQFLLPAKFQHSTVMIGRMLGWTYVVGVMLLLAAGIWKRIRLHLLLRQGNPPPSELQSLFSAMCRHFGVRHCELMVLSRVSSPATVCWWRPRILLPQACSELGDSAALADILNHELAHVSRRDYFLSSMNDLICRLLFFHPGVWQARQQMTIHREMACDLAVVAARPEHRIDYAQTLTRVARLCLPHKHPAIGIDFAAAPSLLTHRIHAILNAPVQSSKVRRLLQSVAGFVLIGGYAFFCSAIAIAIAFAPSEGFAPNVEVPTSSKTRAHPGTRHRAIREEQPSTRREEGLIADSPAYRMSSSSGEVRFASQSSAGPQDSSSNDAINSNIQGWMPPRRGSGSQSPGKTIESVIVATVGTVIGIDKEERKHKDGSGGGSSGSSSHFQNPVTVPNPY